MKLLAVDIGYGYLKALNGTGEQVLIPSVVAPSREIRFQNELASLPQEKKLIVQLGINGERYFVGDMALRQGEMTLSTMHSTKIGKPETEALYSATLALLNNTGDRWGNLVTGLPVGEYSTYRDKLKQSLRGPRVIGLADIQGKMRAVSYFIEEVKVMPQPFGSLFNELLNEFGEIQDERPVGGTVAVIDIGFRTTDYALSSNLEYVDRGSDSSQTALSLAYKQVARALKNRYGIDRQIYELSREFIQGYIRLGGKEVDITNAVEQALKHTADAVYSEATTLWQGKLKEFDLILVTGGGGEALWPYLQPLLTSTAQLAEGAQFANCLGYLKLAHRTWRR